MFYFALLFSLTLAVSPAFGGDFRMARFDAKRVFEQYQHTKDVQEAVSARRNVTGPHSETPDIEERVKLDDQLACISDKIKRTAPGSPEYERLALEQRIAALQVHVAALNKTLADWYRGQDSQKEMSHVRAKIIQEICAEVRVLASAEGYSLIVAENSDSDAFPNVILDAKSDDVTEKLLKRLNDRYRTEMRQPKDTE
jgi:Skp family chaperone for outer membrane proteins